MLASALILRFMGISLNFIPCVLDTVRTHSLSGDLLMLGRQDIGATGPELETLLAIERMKPAVPPNTWRMENGRVTAESFFQAIGFSGVESLDVMQGAAQHVLDLNADVTAVPLRSRCDVLFDGGTLEHVYHVPNALARCADMLRDGGWFLHIGPMNNYVDHGFYQFSPTLWFDWLTTNGWQVTQSTAICLRSARSHSPSGNSVTCPHRRY